MLDSAFDNERGVTRSVEDVVSGYVFLISVKKALRICLHWKLLHSSLKTAGRCTWKVLSAIQKKKQLGR